MPFALGIFDEGTFLNDNKRIKRLLMDCQISFTTEGLRGMTSEKYLKLCISRVPTSSNVE